MSEGGTMLPAPALDTARGRSAVGAALDRAASQLELSEQDEAILRDLDGATPEEIREALDATGARRHPAFMAKMRIGPPGE